MKTLTKQLFAIVLSVIVISLVTNCKQDDLINETEEEQILQEELGGMSIETQKVNIDDVAGLRQYLNLLGRLTQNRNNGSNIVVTPFGNIPLENITEVIDSLGNANYTFAIMPSVHRENKFFNLIVHKESIEEDFSSSVLEYELEENYANDYYNGLVGLSNFYGIIRSYTAEEFLALTGGEGNLRACGEDTGSAMDPCVEDDIDNSDGGTASNDGTGDGSGVGDSNNGDPIDDNDLPDNDDGFVGGGGDTGIGRPCTVGLYIENCGGSNWDELHLLSSCGASPEGQANGDIYTVVDCGSGVQRTGMRDGIGCPINGGPAAVSPVPFASLGMAFNLTPEQDSCLSSAANCEHKNEIYDYLNANTITVNNTVVWEQDAVNFSGVVLDELFDDCEWDFEVDYENGIILDPTFLANEKANCTYKKVSPNSTIKNLLLNFTGENSESKLIFKIVQDLDCNNANNPSGCTENNLAIDGSITIKIDLDYLNSDTTPTIFVARTIIHETIHANLYLALYNFNNGNTVNLPNINDFSAIYEQYRTQIKGWQHEFMANHYAGLMAEALEQIHPSLNDQAFINSLSSDYPDMSLQQFYMSIAYLGLNGTVGQTNYLNNQENFDNYNISFEAAKADSTKIPNCN